MVAAARELGPLGISANVLNPGPVDTDGWTARCANELARQQPGGRLGTPADVARDGWRSSAARGAAGSPGSSLKADGGFSA